MGNSALKMVHTVSWISSLLPGSCPANWLQGNAKISKPAIIVPAEKLKSPINEILKQTTQKQRCCPTKMSDQPWFLYVSYKTLAIVLGHCRIKNKIQKQWKVSLEKFQFRYEITIIIRVMSIKKYRKEGISQKWWW